MTSPYRQATPRVLLKGLARSSAIAVLAILAIAGCTAKVEPFGHTTIEGDPVVIDRLYPPSLGPISSGKPFTLKQTYPEQVWLTEVRVEPRNVETKAVTEGVLSAISVGFVDAARHRQLNSMSGMVSPSIFQLGADMNTLKLPAGYGVPVRSNELLNITSVWQNRDIYRPPLEAHTQTTLTYAQQVPGQPPPKSLRPYSVFVTVPAAEPDKPTRIEPMAPLQVDGDGRTAGGRWWIPQGPSEARALVSYQLPPESELTVRFASLFVYEDWTRAELYDLTASKSLMVFEPKGKVMVKETPEGLVLDTRHRLEIRVSYNNPAVSRHAGVCLIGLYADEPPPEAPAPPPVSR